MFKERAIILLQEPCIVLLGNQIHRVENIEVKIEGIEMREKTPEELFE
ncbi:hypothetical protein FACS189437_08060 [Bacteroidia bacterium]|nr:hypothetical protein FACS189437_08060 [Bacteroidia bacterium]